MGGSADVLFRYTLAGLSGFEIRVCFNITWLSGLDFANFRFIFKGPRFVLSNFEICLLQHLLFSGLNFANSGCFFGIFTWVQIPFAREDMEVYSRTTQIGSGPLVSCLFVSSPT